MPPSIPQNSLICLIRCNASSTTSPPLRAFSTTAHLSLVGPESPKFIEVPLPPQRYPQRPRNIKGKLPPPQNIFHGKRGQNKLQPEFLARTIPEPSPENLTEPKDDRILWKRIMAESRRTNLREGIEELHKRKLLREAAMSQRSVEKQKQRAERLNAPQREDERLTNPTVREAISKPQSGFLADPNRGSRVAEMAERVKAKELERAEARNEALHTLYMHARNFITTEEQLEAEIEAIFKPHPFIDSTKSNADNVWDAWDSPNTIQDMLTAVTGTQKQAINFHSGPGQQTGKRMKRISEELTGGKMD